LPRIAGIDKRERIRGSTELYRQRLPAGCRAGWQKLTPSAMSSVAWIDNEVVMPMAGVIVNGRACGED